MGIVNVIYTFISSPRIIDLVLLTIVCHGGFVGTVHWCVSFLMIRNFSFTVSGEAVRLKPSHKRSSESGT